METIASCQLIWLPLVQSSAGLQAAGQITLCCAGNGREDAAILQGFRAKPSWVPTGAVSALGILSLWQCRSPCGYSCPSALCLGKAIFLLRGMLTNRLS